MGEEFYSLVVVQCNRFVANIPEEAEVSEGGGEVLALIWVPWESKG
jgi:hypothetical protein